MKIYVGIMRDEEGWYRPFYAGTEIDELVATMKSKYWEHGQYAVQLWKDGKMVQEKFYDGEFVNRISDSYLKQKKG